MCGSINVCVCLCDVQARQLELKKKRAMYDKEISDLQKTSISLIKKRIQEVTPSSLLSSLGAGGRMGSA